MIEDTTARHSIDRQVSTIKLHPTLVTLLSTLNRLKLGVSSFAVSAKLAVK